MTKITRKELRQLIKEEAEKILNMPVYKINSNNFILKENISDKLYDDIFKNKYKEVEVSIRYAKDAGEIFRDSFKKYGKMTSTNVFNFYDEEYTVDFVDRLINDLNIPTHEIELAK